jgi:hypothetical protein
VTVPPPEESGLVIVQSTCSPTLTADVRRSESVFAPDGKCHVSVSTTSAAPPATKICVHSECGRCSQSRHTYGEIPSQPEDGP